SLLMAACTSKDGSSALNEKQGTVLKSFSADSLLSKTYSKELEKINAAPTLQAQDSLFKAYLISHEQEYAPEQLLATIHIYERYFSTVETAAGFANEEKAVLFMRISQLDSAMVSIEKAIHVYEENNQKRELARCYNVKAGIVGFKGHLDESFKCQLNALDIYEELADSNGVYETIRELGNTCFSQNLFDRSIVLYERSLSYYQAHNDSFMMADLNNLLGNAYHQIDRDTDSEVTIMKALAIREKIHDDFGMAESYGSLALISMRKSDWQNARVLLEKAIAIFEQIEDYRSINSMIYNLGVCDMELADYKSAEATFDRIINYCKQKNIRDESLIRTLRRKADLLKKEGRLLEAFEAQAYLLDLKDTLFSEERARSFEEMNIKYETQIKEEKLHSIQKENSQISEKRLYLMVGLVLVLILSAALVYVMAKRNHQARLLFDAENKLYQQQLDETQRELAFNRKQLEDFTQHLLEKNKVINEFETRKPDSIQSAEVEKAEENEAEDFSNLMQLKILTDEDWTKFKLFFDRAFPGMIFRLRHEFPSLTGSEQRLFLLIKLKNDSREMSDLLGISMESVRKNKYRLKKKLQLEEDQNLEDFIQHYK
ncbi:MAG: hypothetical protein RLZZ543_1400, partial [Bacteroidota bacterium]